MVCAQHVGLLPDVTLEDQKYPNPPETAATTPLVVSEGGAMAEESKVTPHYLLGIWPQTPEPRTPACWARPPIWNSQLPQGGEACVASHQRRPPLL